MEKQRKIHRNQAGASNVSYDVRRRRASEDKRHTNTTRNAESTEKMTKVSTPALLKNSKTTAHPSVGPSKNNQNPAVNQEQRNERFVI